MHSVVDSVNDSVRTLSLHRRFNQGIVTIVLKGRVIVMLPWALLCVLPTLVVATADQVDIWLPGGALLLHIRCSTISIIIIIIKSMIKSIVAHSAC